jgi:hypothetical protein
MERYFNVKQHKKYVVGWFSLLDKKFNFYLSICHLITAKIRVIVRKGWLNYDVSTSFPPSIWIFVLHPLKTSQEALGKCISSLASVLRLLYPSFVLTKGFSFYGSINSSKL